MSKPFGSRLKMWQTTTAMAQGFLEFELVVRCSCMFLFAKTIESMHAFRKYSLKYIPNTTISYAFYNHSLVCSFEPNETYAHTHTLGCLFGVFRSGCLSVCLLVRFVATMLKQQCWSLLFINMYTTYTTHFKFNVRSLMLGFCFSC